MQLQGENEDIGVLLILGNKKFKHKVIFSSFTDKVQNYALQNVEYLKDTMAIIEKVL